MRVCKRLQESISLSAHEGFTLSESAEWEQLLLPGTCRQIAMAASYQCTSHSKNTLQMTSFCAPTIAPFLQPSTLLHLQHKMNLLPARQSSALLLQLDMALRKISGRSGSCSAVVCSFKLLLCSGHCCFQTGTPVFSLFFSHAVWSNTLLQSEKSWQSFSINIHSPEWTLHQ